MLGIHKFQNYSKYKNVVTILLERINACSEKQIVFVKDSNTDDCLTYAQLVEDAKNLLGHLQKLGVKKGDELILQLEDNRRFVTAFTACLLGNIIAVPLATGAQNEHKKKVANVWAKMKHPFILADEEVLNRLESFFSAESASDKTWWDDIQHAVFLWPSPFPELLDAAIDETALPDDIAYLQFSSGSTGNPKGVMVTHANILHNTDGLLNSSENNLNDVFVIWLPLSHDMGLVGCFLSGILGHLKQVIIPTSVFIRNPIIWMEKMNQHRGSISFSPNFGFKYFLQEWENKKPQVNWDLSCVRAIFNGAEQISPVIIRDFTDGLSEQLLSKHCMLPSYGLAEATLAVSVHKPQTPFRTLTLDRLKLGIGDTINTQNTEEEKTITFVSCGKPIEQVSARITDENHNLLPERTVGLIEIKGANVTAGYYRQDNEGVFSADQWLVTGDIGFFYNEELYLVGRHKEMMIVNGLNYYPYDIEKVLESIDPKLFALTKVAAASVLLKDQVQESLIIFITFRNDQEAFKQVSELVKRTVMKHFGLVVTDVVAVKRIPKTTSGKLQRRKLALDYLADIQLQPIQKEQSGKVASHQKEQIIIQTIHDEIIKLYGFKDIKNEQPLVEQGFDSLRSTELINALSRIFQVELSPTLVFEYATINQLANYLVQLKSKISEKGIETATNEKAYEPVAIIGMSCVFPGGANSPEQLWEVLINGIDTVKEIPNERWNARAYYDEDFQKPGKTNTLYGSLIDNVKEFDAGFFGISPREAESLDPQQRLLLEVSFQALQSARYTLADINGSNTGVFVGFSHSDYMQADIHSGNLENIDPYSLTGTINSTAAGRLSYFYNLIGPALIIDTACSSSLAAVHSACRSLQFGDCDMALAGGVNLILTPESYIALTKTQALSPDGRCKTFDEAANGYGRGEGCGIVVLKRLKDALANGDHIMGTIRSSAINQDGKSNGLTAPNGIAQQKLLQKAISVSGFAAEEISYIEAHGTGTPLGDPLEVHAINMAYQSPNRKNKLLVGSIKSNIGHLESAAGIAGLIKILMCFRNRELPANLHFNNPNPYISWNDLAVVQQNTKLDQKLIAGLSSFGFSGTNAHIILEEPPAKTIENNMRSHSAFTLSAHSEDALKQMATNLRKHLLHNDIEATGAICHHLNRSNNLLPFRWHAVVKDKNDLLQQLVDLQTNHKISPQKTQSQQLLAFQFTGQGAQYTGMAKELYLEFEVYRNALNDCDQIYRKLNGDTSLISVIFEEDSENRIHQTKFTQPAIFCTAYALTKLFESFGVRPDLVFGHSVGEFVAFCIAGMISLEDGIKLICVRASLMQKLPEGGGMMSVLAPKSEVLNAIGRPQLPIAIAGINSPHQTVVSGLLDDLEKLKKQLQAEGFTCIPLTVSHAFHSPLMQSISEELLQTVKEITFDAPRIPVISNVTGKILTNEQWNDPTYFIQHLLQPVEFVDSVLTLQQLGCTACIEIGPQPVLTNLGKQILPDFKDFIYTLRKGQSSTAQFLQSLCSLQETGTPVNWKKGDATMNYNYVTLPPFPFQRKKYWKELTIGNYGTAPVVPNISAEKQSDVLYDVDYVSFEKNLLTSNSVHQPVVLIYDRELNLANSLEIKYRDQGIAVQSHPIQVLDKNSLFQDKSVLIYIANRSLIEPPTVNYDDLRHVVALCKSIGFKSTISKLILVTSDVHPNGQTPVNFNHSFLWGFGTAFQSERTKISVSTVDINITENIENELLFITKHAAQLPLQLIVCKGEWQIPRLTAVKEKPDESEIRFKSDASYIVTGGFGSIGEKLVDWMIRKGAKHMILIGRSKITASHEDCIKKWRENAKIEYLQADISNFDDLQELAVATNIRGIFHTAAILNDKLLQSHDTESFESVLPSKVQGAWNLHQLSLLWPLDYFVMFSSTVSLFGNPGQTNYAAANYFLNGLAHYRKKQNLPAHSICWGPWKDSKMTSGLVNNFEELGILSFESEAAFSVLERALLQKNNSGTFAAIDVKPNLIKKNTPLWLHSLLPNEWQISEENTGATEIQVVSFDTQQEALSIIEPLARAVLKLQPSDFLAVERPFFEVGFDSMMLSMLQGQIFKKTGIKISIPMFFQYPTLNGIADYLANFKTTPQVSESELEIAVSTPAVSDKLREEVSQLSDEEITQLLNQY